MNWLEIGKTEIQSPKFTIEIQDFPYKLNKFWENSRILIKLKQKNSISGISETGQYPESGQKKGCFTYFNQLPLSTIYVWKQESGSVSTGLQNGESGGTAVASSVNGNGSNNSRFESRIKYDIKAAAMRQGAFYYQVSLPHYRYGH